MGSISDLGTTHRSPTMMYDMTYGQHQLVYNFTSFTLACMMASTVFFWLRLWGVAEEYRTALCITGLVTFIAFYHYVRIFNSWVESYEFPASTTGEETAPVLTGKPFNDAYRYMDWLLTVPPLLMELVLVMDLSKEEKQKQSAMLGVSSAAMIAVGYPGEMIIDPPYGTRWACWFFSMCVFSYIVYTLLKGLDGAHQAEVANDAGMAGAQAVVGIQVGYCISDIISKCGVGLLTYRICVAKSGGAPLSAHGAGGAEI